MCGRDIGGISFYYLLLPPHDFRRTIAETGLTRTAEIRQRSVRIRGLPANSQEGLLQQILEKIAPVKRLEIFEEKREAVAELENAAVCEEILS